jgi:Tol biopolymer transport system component
MVLTALMTIAACLTHAGRVRAQTEYFGRNKVQYEHFQWRVMRTEHFDIHFYPQEEQAVRDAARMAERWYARLSRVFNHQLAERKPIILYANQGDFQQTNVTAGQIEEGTGGFTEGLKDRVTLPLTGSYEENDHVIGHELVHSFQYDIAKGGPGIGLDALQQLPLWLIEGMAEYLSIGREDPLTAMWMRDAVLRKDLPTLEQLTRDFKYFPYRYGQAFWAYFAGRFGDQAIGRYYNACLKAGWENAMRQTLSTTPERLSRDWIDALRRTYGPLVANRSGYGSAGREVIGADKVSGDLNVGPEVSPDGRYVIFFSSRDLFSIDLYLANVVTGRVIRKLVSTVSDQHFDALRFITSAGAWSHDGRKFAFVAFAGGNDQIAIVDVATQDIDKKITIDQVGQVTNLTWAPDGKSILFSGARGGISDLYSVDIASERLTQLTDDRYADFQPVYSPDGRTVAFVTDRGPGTDFDRLSYGNFRIALMDMTTHDIRTLALFDGAKNINPQFSPDGQSLYFISDHEGYSDIYRVALAGGAITQLTRLATGVSGITASSPALSVSAMNGRLMFSTYEQGRYAIYSLDPATVSASTPAPGSADVAGILPPVDSAGHGMVSAYLRDPATGLPAHADYPVSDYSPSFSLDYLGTPGIGVSVGGYGAGLAGGAAALFSDLLGNYQVGGVVQINGGFQDIGGEVFYQNLASRLNWGVSAQHIPYLSSSTTIAPVSVDVGGNEVMASSLEQTFEHAFIDGVTGMVSYPLNTTQRFEGTFGFDHISYSTQVEQTVFSGDYVLSEQTRDVVSPPSLNLAQASVAFVGDYSFFGFTSPVTGGRYRFEIDGTTGSENYATLVLDYRHYFYERPVTVALRALHYGRYGPDAESPDISPIFLGYESLVRGYSAASFTADECSGMTGENGCPQFNRLIGSRIAVANLEVRVPLLGTSDFGLINFPYLPTELSAFLDGGVAWSAGDSPVLHLATRSDERIPVFSAGVSTRVNLFGYLVVELFYAYPFQRPDAGWQFGFQVAPGW